MQRTRKSAVLSPRPSAIDSHLGAWLSEKRGMNSALGRNGPGRNGSQRDWLCLPSIRHAVHMLIPTKVVPIAEEKSKLIARDTKAHRIIFGIGSQRMAVDFFSRITKLPPNTGDQPATVLPMDQKQGKKRRGPAGRPGRKK